MCSAFIMFLLIKLTSQSLITPHYHCVCGFHSDRWEDLSCFLPHDRERAGSVLLFTVIAFFVRHSSISSSSIPQVFSSFAHFFLFFISEQLSSCSCPLSCSSSGSAFPPHVKRSLPGSSRQLPPLSHAAAVPFLPFSASLSPSPSLPPSFSSHLSLLLHALNSGSCPAFLSLTPRERGQRRKKKKKERKSVKSISSCFYGDPEPTSSAAGSKRLDSGSGENSKRFLELYRR